MKKKQQLILLKYKNHNRILQTIIYQQIRQTRSNEQISRNIQLTKTESKETDHLNRPIIKNKIESVKTKKLSTNKSPGPDGL